MPSADLTTAAVSWAVVALALAVRWLRLRRERSRERDIREHERVTGWFADLRTRPGTAILRDDGTGQIVLPSTFTRGSGGRHRRVD